jgi:hypothetical protein
VVELEVPTLQLELAVVLAVEAVEPRIAESMSLVE